MLTNRWSLRAALIPLVALVAMPPSTAAAAGSAIADLVTGGAFLGLGILGTVKASSAADDADAAEAAARGYAVLFLDDYTASAICYGAYLADGFPQDLQCANDLLASATIWADLGSAQTEIEEDRRGDENRWKGMSYVAYAAGGYLIVKGIVGLASEEDTVEHGQLVPDLVPEVGPEGGGFALAWYF
jgi:hypothetical protein